MADKENKYEAGFSSDAKKDPVRVVFVTKKTSAKVTGEDRPQVMTYPHLLMREAIAFMVLVIALVGVALFWMLRSNSWLILCSLPIQRRRRGISSGSRSCCTTSLRSSRASLFRPWLSSPWL